MTNAAVAVALPRTPNPRAPSAYLKPAPTMVTSPPVPTHRPRWPWVVIAIFVLLGFAFASGVGFIDGSATEPRIAPPPSPKRAPHTIAQVQYGFVTVGTGRNRVIAGLGHQPAARADYRRIFPTATTKPACDYYYGKAPKASYAFCFNADGILESKAIRTLPLTAPKVKPQA